MRREARLREEADALLADIASRKMPLPDAWNEALKARAVSGSALATAFVILNEKQQYDSCIEGLQAAIRNDLGQPWMYDVLAAVLSMANRPQKEIDRVLLSRVDFTDGNEAQMLITASMLSQFRAYEQAMLLCRETAKRNPWQPANWSIARSIADRSSSTDHIVWSRVGTLKHVWGSGFETHHAEATAVLKDLQERLELSRAFEEALAVKQALNEALIRDLRIKLEWAGDADLDLVVTEPDGQICSYKSELTRNGGVLARQAFGGGGRQTEEYVCAAASPGDYTVTVKNLFGRLITGRVRITITRHQGTEREQVQSAFYEIGSGNLDVKVPLKNGRGEAVKK